MVANAQLREFIIIYLLDSMSFNVAQNQNVNLLNYDEWFKHTFMGLRMHIRYQE